MKHLMWHLMSYLRRYLMSYLMWYFNGLLHEMLRRYLLQKLRVLIWRKRTIYDDSLWLWLLSSQRLHLAVPWSEIRREAGELSIWILLELRFLVDLLNHFEFVLQWGGRWQTLIIQSNMWVSMVGSRHIDIVGCIGRINLLWLWWVSEVRVLHSAAILLLYLLRLIFQLLNRSWIMFGERRERCTNSATFFSSLLLLLLCNFYFFTRAIEVDQQRQILHTDSILKIIDQHLGNTISDIGRVELRYLAQSFLNNYINPNLPWSINS